MPPPKPPPPQQAAASPAKARAAAATSTPSHGSAPREPLLVKLPEDVLPKNKTSMNVPPKNVPPKNVPPKNVPPEAEWQVNERTWRCGSKDSSGRLHGLQRYYRPDGTLRAEYHYNSGERSGPFRRYHPDGTLAREGKHRADSPLGQVIAYRASAASDEPLRRCCVPPGAHKMVVQYGDEGIESEAFLDQQGRLLLPDGSLHPERPAGVDVAARYVPENEQWESGRNRATRRDGVWKWWAKSGELREVAEFSEGQHHGVRQIYSAGQLVATWTYRRGTLHGSGSSQVTPGTYLDSRIAWQRGHFVEGVSSGVWSYLDAQRAPLFEANLGMGLKELSPDDPVFSVHPPESSAPKLHPARAWLLHLRQLSRGPSALEPPGRVGSPPPLTREASQKWIEISRNTPGNVAAVLAKLLEALMRGAAPSLVLREMACYLMHRPAAGLALIDASLALEPGALEAQTTRLLLLAELGQPEAARHLLAELHPRLGPEASSLQALLDITFPRFDYVPARLALDSNRAEQLPDRSVPDVRRLQQAVGKAALRLSLIRHALRQRLEQLDQSPQANWLPPDVSSLARATIAPSELTKEASTDPAPRLESYTFEAEFEGDSPEDPPTVDTVIVDETLKPDGDGIGDLMRRARAEWASLCWLCYSAGLDEVALPVEARSPQNFGQAITTAFTRHHRLQDQIRTLGVRSRALGATDFEWEGLSIASLGSTLLKQAHDEYLEMRAMLYFVADETCRSPWQDDLRA